MATSDNTKNPILEGVSVDYNIDSDATWRELMDDATLFLGCAVEQIRERAFELGAEDKNGAASLFGTLYLAEMAYKAVQEGHLRVLKEVPRG